MFRFLERLRFLSVLLPRMFFSIVLFVLVSICLSFLFVFDFSELHLPDSRLPGIDEARLDGFPARVILKLSDVQVRP